MSCPRLEYFQRRYEFCRIEAGIVQSRRFDCPVRAAWLHDLVSRLTCWAQVNGRDELPIPEKVALEFEHLECQSIGFDAKILWITFAKVVRCYGVSH